VFILFQQGMKHFLPALSAREMPKAAHRTLVSPDVPCHPGLIDVPYHVDGFLLRLEDGLLAGQLYGFNILPARIFHDANLSLI
jgi:hypothetical protein